MKYGEATYSVSSATNLHSELFSLHSLHERSCDAEAAPAAAPAEAKEKLIPLAIETVTNRTLLDSLGQNALKMALPDSAEIIAKEVLKLADKNN